MQSVGLLHLAHVDTCPGGHGPFAPPADWSGDEAAYRVLMRERYCHPGLSQQMVVTARRYRDEAAMAEPIRFEGPWADEARRFLEAL